MRDDLIRLRPILDADLDEEYCSWYKNNDDHLKYFTGSGRTFNLDVLRADVAEGLRTRLWFYYVIETLEGERVGNVKIGPIDLKHKTSDLVCLVGNRKFIGKGVGARAIALANCIAFQQHDIRRLQGGMYAANVPSIRAYVKAGWFIEANMQGYYLVEGLPMDRVCVACLNPKVFAKKEVCS